MSNIFKLADKTICLLKTHKSFLHIADTHRWFGAGVEQGINWKNEINIQVGFTYVHLRIP